MMLAPTLTGSRSRIRFRVRGRVGTLDAALLLVSVALAAAFFFQGGLEALLGAGAGAIIAWRGSSALVTDRTVSGAFAGLFAGALAAGFFHGAVVALANQLF
jgi:hypothetical protein